MAPSQSSALTRPSGSTSNEVSLALTKPKTQQLTAIAQRWGAGASQLPMALPSRMREGKGATPGTLQNPFAATAIGRCGPTCIASDLP
jgi:hypothetical protein